MEAQIEMTLAARLAAQRRFEQADDAVSRAKEVALAADYRVGVLKALAYTAAIQTTLGAYHQGMRLNHAGLENYWSQTYPPYRGYQFYYDMAADTRGLHLARVTAD
jgi:hypothetical protein